MQVTQAAPPRRADLKARARAEFIEMPGLTLTLEQASKLCGGRYDEIRRVLDELVAEGLLRRSGDHYRRVDAERRCA